MKQAKLTNSELCKLKPFEYHPYKVQDDAEMEALTESIKENGIMTPLLVRSLNDHLNGVSYTVQSRFEPPKEGRSVRSAFQKMISGDMVDLMNLAEDDKLSSEYVCSAAGEED